ncbi:MAG TPA: hypothetical protein VK524_00395 [Polyangiaceae bacterium]|nr:hypothetical protein [Polyangiaceae bacterium]
MSRLRRMLFLFRACKSAAAVSLAVLALGCNTGEGTGEVRSERLFVEDCWNGPFNLQPDFFAAVPFEEETLFIRVQHGDDHEGVSDGLSVLVNELPNVRRNEIGIPITVGLPAGVSPPGVPLELEPDPPHVSLTLYLHDSCEAHTADLYSISGTITFDSIFSGDLNEHDGADRLTEAEFEAEFADPRKASPDGSFGEGLTSTVRGRFRFYFQRGQPAQPFL